MTKWVRWNNPSKAYYRVPVSWRAQATWPTQDLVKHVKRTVAASSESSQLPLSSSSPGCSEAQSDNKWRSTKRCRSRSTASKPTKRGDPRMDGRDESHQGWGREVGTQPARNPVDFVRRPKERPSWRGPSSLQQTWIREITLDLSIAATRRGTGEIGRSLWIYPWQQPAENQKIRRSLWIWISCGLSRRADPEGKEGRRCSRWWRGSRLVQEGGAPPWTLSRSSTCDDWCG